MSDIHALVGAYTVDAVDDVERAAFERHLATCTTCQVEVSGLREAASLIASTVSLQPPSSLRDRVLADIATVRPLPPVNQSSSIPGGRTRFRPRALMAAAAAVIALGAGAAVVQPWEDDTTQVQLSAADRVRGAADAETFSQTLENGAEATVIRSRSLNEAVLVTDDMPAAPSGSVYELWLIQDKGLVSAGVMAGGDDEVLLAGDVTSANGFGITVEPEGGSAEPTLPPVTTIVFKSA